MNEPPIPAGAAEPSEVHPSRWTLIRDVAVFQLKLALDGFRDLVMMPISMGLAVLDLLGVGPRPGRQFYLLLNAGRESEKWIDLFGATKHLEEIEPPDAGIDSLVGRMERLVVQEYERGGITTSAKRAVDRALDGLSRDSR